MKTYTEIDSYVNDNIPNGRIIEIVGVNDFYKTSCILSVARSILENDSETIIIYIDCDHHLKAQYLADYGINYNNFMIADISRADSILDIIQSLTLYTFDNVVVIIDTVSNIIFNSVFKDLNRLLIDISKTILNTNITVFAINQCRYNNVAKDYQPFCEKSFRLYSPLGFTIIDKVEDELILKIHRNKITSDLNCKLKINIRKQGIAK